MFQKIMCPVDLAHAEKLAKALTVSADLARHYDCPLVYVGVTTTAPGRLGHNPEEFAQKLDAFAEEQTAGREIRAETLAVIAHDPTTEVDDALMRAIGDTGADLVVMASHVPSILDYVWPSNGGKLAEHAKCSVMVVRG
jgi:nucleotide-binding universal stress UspA family protein